MTRLIDEGKAVGIVYQDLSKAFVLCLSHSILQGKVAAHGLDRYALCWVKNCLGGWAQRVLVIGVKSSWQPVMSGVPVQYRIIESQNCSGWKRP